MNQLVKATSNALAPISPISKKALESLSPSEKAIIAAALKPKVLQLDPESVSTEFIAIIDTAYTIAGQQAEGKTLALFADELCTRLIDTYPLVSIDEVRIALRNGVYGEYGEYFGLNPKSFMQFIGSYLKSKERNEARSNFEYNRLELLYTKNLTPAEKEQSNKDFVNELFADFLAGRLVTWFIPSFIYDFLEERKLIALSKEDKKALLEKAKANYEGLAANARVTSSIAGALNDFMFSSNPEAGCKVIAKQYAVWQMFEKHQANGETVIFENVKIDLHEKEN